MSLQGSLSELPLPDVIQLVSVSGKTGAFDIQSNEGAGKIFLRDGQIVDALVGRLRGDSAVYEMAIWSEGTFSFNPGSDFQDLGVGETRDVTFTYQVDDGQGGTDSATVTITVAVTNDAPVANDVTVTGPAAAPLITGLHTRNDGRKIKLSWRTIAEPDLDGFFVLRSSEADGIYTKINPSLLRARGSTFYGETYAFLDEQTEPGAVYWYKIETKTSAGKDAYYGQKGK